MTKDSQSHNVRSKNLFFNLLIGLWGSIKIITSDSLGLVGFILMGIFLFFGVFGPWIAPYGPFEVIYLEGGAVARYFHPSWDYLLGTNSQAQDVLSQLIHGVRYAIVIGFISAIVSALVGTILGLISGYYGGIIDNIIMRLTDIAFGIPFLPFALIYVGIMGTNIVNTIIVISLFLWRTTARVIRSQVLTLKERPFVLAARLTGASNFRILFIYIAPNILGLTFLSVALGVSLGVLMEAGLSFLGFGDPFTMTWGQMLNMSFQAGAMRNAWWWVLPPGISLTVFVTATYLITRAYEEMINPRLREY